MKKVFEYILAVLPFIVIMIWGNNVTLCSIIPVAGGAIGGFISGAFSGLNFAIFPKLNNIFLKVIIAIGTIIASFLICFVIAVTILPTLL